MASRPQKFIQGAIKHPGALTATAKRMGKTVAQLIASPPKNASAVTKKRIQFAKVLAGVRPKGKGSRKK